MKNNLQTYLTQYDVHQFLNMILTSTVELLEILL